jgi:hypothetical protein
MNRTVVAGIVCLFSTVLLAGCNKVEERLVLPWFKVRTSVSPKIGGLADPVQTTEYFVKRSGFWRRIDDAGVGGATVLNARTVAYYDNGEARLIHEGDAEATLVCGPGLAGASFPAGTEAVDCVNVVAGPAAAVATTVRFRRISASGAILNDKTIAVEAPGRVFLQPMVTFYDEEATAYLITLDHDFRVARNCAIVAVGVDEVRFTAGSPTLPARDCSEASSWTPLLGHALRSRDK